MEGLMDMHTHTCYSDGEYQPKELIELAKDKGISTMAITDHDTIKGVKRARELSRLGLELFEGIELSAHREHGRMHILGYQIDLDNKELNEMMDVLHNRSLQSVLSVMEQIKRDYGIVFDYRDIQELVCADRNIGRPDLAKLCVKYGYAKTIEEAFKKYLIAAKEKVKGTNKELSYEECLDLIKNSGGVAVLAHPKTLDLSEKDFLVLLKELIQLGLQGMEVYHSSHSQEEMDFYHRVALEYDLLESGGSDYHGPFVKPNIELGTGKNNNLKIKQLSLVDYLRTR